MKKSMIATIVGSAATLGIGALAVLWYGNQPIKEYYPNEAIKSITQRKMFQHTGKYQLFAQDGKMIEEYEQINGVKNGKASIFFNDGSADFTYVNNQLTGSLKINSKKFDEYLKDTEINFDDTTVKMQNGETFEVGAKITCDEDKFITGLQSFLDVQNYAHFQDLFKCLNINKASFESEDESCKYTGGFNFPKFLENSTISCEETNVDLLKSYTPDFEAITDLSAGLTDVDNVDLNVGSIGNIESLKFDTSFDTKTGKISFDLTTVSDKINTKQKISFGGFENLIESATEFAFSPQEDADSKKFLISVLKNLSWSDWEVAMNDQKRFTIEGDFNLINGFSDPYVMSYYSDKEVTTQWKFDAKGTRISSKYPHTNKPMMSFGLNINDGFKKAYKSLVSYGLDAFSTDASMFDPNVLEKLQTDGAELVKGISSVSGILMNTKGQKMISGVMALQKDVKPEVFMLAPTQFMNFKVALYQNDHPTKVYVGNFNQGFTMNGRKLSDAELQVEMQNVIDEFQKDIDSIIAELKKSYGDINELDATWVNSDVDPFLFGFYKGYTGARKQYMQPEEEDDDDEEEISFDYIIEDIEEAPAEDKETSAEAEEAAEAAPAEAEEAAPAQSEAAPAEAEEAAPAEAEAAPAEAEAAPAEAEAAPAEAETAPAEAEAAPAEAEESAPAETEAAPAEAEEAAPAEAEAAPAEAEAAPAQAEAAPAEAEEAAPAEAEESAPAEAEAAPAETEAAPAEAEAAPAEAEATPKTTEN